MFRWRVVPPAALFVVGIALLVTIVVGEGRTTLIWLGVGLLVLSVALGVGAQRYAAPAGDISLAPAAGEWPLDSRHSFGNVRVDLTEHPLPEQGRLDLHLGAGNVTLLMPNDAPVRVDVTVTAGSISRRRGESSGRPRSDLVQREGLSRRGRHHRRRCRSGGGAR